MDIMDLHERGIVQLGVIADKLGCDISGSTDDVDLCMVTHCRNPIGYAVLRGNQWSRISEQEFNKFSKPSKHVYIESIDVSLDPDTARLPGYRNASGSDAFQDSDRLPVSGSAGTPAYLRRSGEMERQALDGYCTSQLAAAP